MTADTSSDSFTLTYRSFSYTSLGIVLLCLSAVMVAALLLPVDLFVRRILILILVISGVGAIFSLKTAKRMKDASAWYLCFQPNQVRLNFFDYVNSNSGPQSDMAVLDIPRDQITFIRKTTKRGSDGDPDKLYVDMQVSYPIWESAKGFRTDCQSHFDPMSVDTRAGAVQFFERNIIRVLLDQSQWPEGLAAHWATCRYNVADAYEIQPGTSIEMTKNGSKNPL